MPLSSILKLLSCIVYFERVTGGLNLSSNLQTSQKMPNNSPFKPSSLHKLYAQESKGADVVYKIFLVYGERSKYEGRRFYEAGLVAATICEEY